MLTPSATPVPSRARSEQASLVFLVQGVQKGKPAWAYTLVKRSRLEMFQHRVSQEFIDVREYGDILYSGWGDAPPDFVTMQIKKDFLH